ncbi:hypothetical protein ACFCX0_16745 [Streptomyces sp. NPDC056352]|uniref:hypothetical protein n=1 Tax=Streptomyces sp. NPDC056352 TaxID=3345791 RepID=UPI0035DCB13D
MTGAGLYTKTENWDKTLGDHKIWGSAEVTSQGDKFTMTITVRAMDRYDFNKDMKDNENGRFATLGWAKPFMVNGPLTRVVTWKRGDVGSSTVVTHGPR